MRAISDEAVKALINSGISTDTDADREYVCECIDNIPTIEPKRGKWIWQSSMAGSFIERRYRCSNCQYEITTQREEPIYNYCPNCGAEMKGATDGNQ